MWIKRLTAFACALFLLCATGCGQSISENNDVIESSSEQGLEERNENIDLKTDEDFSDGSEITQTDIALQQIKYVKYDKTIQAEDGTISGGTKIDKTRKGYKGKGYVTNFNGSENKWEIAFDLSDSQFYNIAVTAASDKAVTTKLAVNGEIMGEIPLSGSKAFETFSLSNIYIKKGTAVITMISDDVTVDVDFVKVTSAKDSILSGATAEKAQLSNKNANANAKALYKYLCENYGKKVILGQYDTVGTHVETDKIYEVTGKYPAIRFGDLMPFTQDKNISAENEIEYAVEWSKSGGIVGYMWHWTDPSGSGEYYADKTDFDLSKAVTKEDIATLSDKQIDKLHKEKKISDECAAIIKDIDRISEQLKILQDNGISVIWRPIQEASNGYFWWGKDSASYKWLWKLLYERQTEYHKLNNLIWVWSAQNADWYVGDKQCDIISADIYDKNQSSGQLNTLLFLTKICNSKPIAMSECGSFPDINAIAEENALWSYIGQWGGNYLINDDGNLSEEYNTAEQLIKIYNNSLVITKDKLPDNLKSNN